MVDVHTAPGWYFEDEKVSLGQGDSVQVTGRPKSLNGEMAIEATELRIFSNAVQLRQQDGSPKWDEKKSGFFGRRRR
jgi:lysyl-tRNA synthetase class II